jgi:hypothetical protein
VETTLPILSNFSINKSQKNRKSLMAIGQSQYFAGERMRVMTRSSILASLFIITMLAMGALPLSIGASLQPNNSGYSLQNTVSFTNYGQLIVNDTLFANASATQTIGSVTFGYPINYSGHIAAESASYSIGGSKYIPTLSSATTSNELQITLALSPNIPAAKNASVSVSFYVVDSLVPIASANYSAPVVLYPSVQFQPSASFNFTKVQSTILFPVGVQLASSLPPKGFTSSTGNLTLSPPLSNISNSESSSAEIYVTPPAADLMFQSIQRSLSPNPSGVVIVTDTIAITNLGLSATTSLNFNLLTNSTRVTFLETAEPTLRNAQQLGLATPNVLPLGSVGLSIQPDSTELIKIQYPLGTQYWKYSGGEYVVTIPNTVPVSAVVNRYSVSFSAPAGFVQTGGHTSVQLANVSGNRGTLSFSYRKGIGSAFGSALPIGSTLFVVTLIGALIFRPRAKEGEDLESAIELLRKSIEDKVSGTNEILTDLKSRASSLTRQDLITARSRIEELRARTSNRFRDLRAELQSTGEAPETSLNNIAGNDREFDLTAREIVNSYEQLISKRMKYDTFTKILQNNERRLQRIATTLLDSVHEFSREYEA